MIKHLLIYFQGSGAWILQDDTFTFNNFAHAFKDQDVGNAVRQQDGSSLHIVTGSEGDWTNGHIAKNDFSKLLKVTLNPADKLENVHGVLQFAAYISNFVRVRQLNELLQSSDVVGNIRFSRPTLYIFPGCQGDSALFGISGFNLLVNGGYSRKACFWDFTRHLDRIDAALMTHLGTDNLYGFGSVLQRKSIENVHPEIGFMYVNASDKIKALPHTEASMPQEESLHVNLAAEGNKLIQYAKQIGPIPHSCSRNQSGQTIEPINLYHKVGIGSLDMYILNPITDSKEMKEFYQQWNQNAAQFGLNQHMSLPNTLSVCALLVWQPSNPNDNITRIFFPGNAPQHKVLEGLEKLKTLDILKQPQCTKTSLTAKPVAKKSAGLSSKPPARSKVSPVTTPKNEVPKKEIKENATTKPSTPRSKTTVPPTQKAKKEKEDVNKKTMKIPEKTAKTEKSTKTEKMIKAEKTEKINKKPEKPNKVEKTNKAEKPEKANKAEKTDKAKKTTTLSKGSAKSPPSSSPKEAEKPVKEAKLDKKQEEKAEVIAPPPANVPDILDTAPQPAVLTNGSKELPADIPAFSSEPLEPTPATTEQSNSLIDISPSSVPEPSQPPVTAEPTSTLDREKMLELGIYDEDQDIEQDLNAQQATESDKRLPQMFGGMADSMHEDLLDDMNAKNAMQGSFHGDLMSGSMHEAMFDNKKPFDGPFAQNGDAIIDEVITPEDDISEEIQPQALPEPVAYAPESYGQEPDVIPIVSPKEECQAISEPEVTPTSQEPDLLPVKQEESRDYDEESTVPVEKIEHPTMIETPDEVENSLPEDVQEKDLSEETEKSLIGDEPFVADKVQDEPLMGDFEEAEKIKDVVEEESAFNEPAFNEPKEDILLKDIDKVDEVKQIENEYQDEPAPVESEVVKATPDTVEETSLPEMESELAPVESEISQTIPDTEDQKDFPQMDSELVPKEDSNVDLIEKLEESRDDLEKEIESQDDLEKEIAIMPEVAQSDIAPEILPDHDMIVQEKEIAAFQQCVPEAEKDELLKVSEQFDDRSSQEFSPEPELPVQDDEPELETVEHGSPEVPDAIERPVSPEPDQFEQDKVMIEQMKEEKLPTETQELECITDDNNVKDFASVEDDLYQPGKANEFEKDVESEGERADSPDSQIGAQDINRDSLERDNIKEPSPFSEDDQRDSIERDVQEPLKDNIEETERDSIERSLSPADENVGNIEMDSKDSVERSLSPSQEAEQRQSLERSVSPEQMSPEQRQSIERSISPEQRDSIERSVSPEQRESTEKSFEDESEESDEEDEESSSFDQEEATDEKCLIQDSLSDNQGIKAEGTKVIETDSLAAPADSLGDQLSDNLMTPESDYTDASHGGQIGYHQIDEQDGDSVDGIDEKEAFTSQPPVQRTNPFGDGLEQFGAPSFGAGPMSNPFETSEQQPSYNPFDGYDKTYEEDRSSSPDKDFAPSGGPAGFNPLSEWGEPMGLPSPAPPGEKNETGAAKKATAKKPDAKRPASATKKPATSNGVPDKSKNRLSLGGASANTRTSTGGSNVSSPRAPSKATPKSRPSTAPVDTKSKMNGAKRPATATGSRASPSAVKMPPLPPFHPFYVDLTYIPNHGNPSYSDVEFFKRVRARYYVLSALSPNTHVLDALLEGKKTWEDKSLAVTVIPTYDNETLRLWMSLHKERLAEEKVEIAPSASRCTIQLQDHETSSSAYRLEF